MKKFNGFIQYLLELHAHSYTYKVIKVQLHICLHNLIVCTLCSNAAVIHNHIICCGDTNHIHTHIKRICKLVTIHYCQSEFQTQTYLRLQHCTAVSWFSGKSDFIFHWKGKKLSLCNTITRVLRQVTCISVKFIKKENHRSRVKT